MEKKKLKLSISGSTNKTINSIEQAKNQSKNTVVIEKKPKRFLGKPQSARPFSTNDKFNLRRAGTGSSDLPDLKAEFSDAPHEKGTLSMARSSDPNSANSQFFICFEAAPHLDRQYSVFGKVISGMEFVDKIKRGDGANGAVSDPDKIISLKSSE